MYTQVVCGYQSMSIRRISRERLLSTAVIIPGSYICGYEDLEDVRLELGKVRKPLSLNCMKAMMA